MSKKLGKLYTMLPPAAARQLTAYPWPGNVRELEHTLELAALLSVGSTLEIPSLHTPATQAGAATEDGAFVPVSLHEWERRCIQATLRYCDGRVRGRGGGADLPEMHPSTLDARIRKLGIKKKVVIK